MKNPRVLLAGNLLLMFALGACARKAPSGQVQGYVEGEFVYVSSPLAGVVTKLAVRRGDQVTEEQPLFDLDSTMEKAARDQARTALTLSEAEFARQEKLFRAGPAAAQDFDRAKSTRDQDRDRLAQAEWSLAQKHQDAPKAGLIYDTLFREGEWVAAGKPVVMLLPPPNIKVRAFVPETMIGSLRIGQNARVTIDGVSGSAEGRISYLSTRAEFTPPVIYSRESRSKLVFMVEITFAPEVAEKLHPGQPVDVSFASS
ncbi:MAG: HlyD family efflux transporter periplasmic adaptor subunit [Verrucomicrobiota bacterium]|nr:HlyD family efflux transporter periplasmic adaptor subunit [Verrucomicrobiota bacterium]